MRQQTLVDECSLTNYPQLSPTIPNYPQRKGWSPPNYPQL